MGYFAIVTLALMMSGQAHNQLMMGGGSGGPLTHEGPTVKLSEAYALDVPAIQVDTETGDTWWYSCPDTESRPCSAKIRGTIRTWGCADKRRVLLTAEDGTHHCILFEAK